MAGGTYEELGGFIRRQAPYTQAELPSFGIGAPADDLKLLADISANLKTVQPFMTNHDQHVVAVSGPYADFNAGKPSDKKSEEFSAMERDATLTWRFDGIDNTVTKAIRIEYTHIRKVDSKVCHAFILIGFTGDDH
jgi:hypothetical protein